MYNRDGHLVKWIQAAGGCVTAFDFTTKEILQTAIPGMIGLRLGNAVTFIDNHDTGFTQNLWPFPPDKVIQGYVYILTHLGIPSIVSSFLLFLLFLSPDVLFFSCYFHMVLLDEQKVDPGNCLEFKK